jgi:hypothetical protein
MTRAALTSTQHFSQTSRSPLEIIPSPYDERLVERLIVRKQLGGEGKVLAHPCQVGCIALRIFFQVAYGHAAHDGKSVYLRNVTSTLQYGYRHMNLIRCITRL